jgi:hypothetical protein
MTVNDLIKARDELVMVPGANKDLVIAVYNIGIAITERLDKFTGILPSGSVFDMVFGKK